LPEHPEAEFFLKAFSEYGIGMLGDRGVPMTSHFIAACPMMKVYSVESKDLLLSIFRSAAAGLSSAIEKSRNNR
jgi:hypothetical protein